MKTLLGRHIILKTRDAYLIWQETGESYTDPDVLHDEISRSWKALTPADKSALREIVLAFRE
jgi:hypothetical protein